MKIEKQKQSIQFDEQGNILSSKSQCAALHEQIIHIYYSINQHKYCPVILAAVMILFAYLQLYSQLMDERLVPRNDKYWGPFLSVAEVLELTRISALLLDSSGSEVWVFIYTSIIFLLLYIAGIYFMHHSIQIRKLYFVLPIEACSLFTSVLLWLYIGPICEVFVSIFYCTSGPNPEAILMPGTQCWSGIHVTMACVLCTSMIIYILLAIAAALYSNASNPSFLSSREDGLSRLDTNTELYNCLFRIITSLLFKWLLDKKLEWVFLLIHLVYGIVFVYRFYRAVPYYNPFISSLYGGCVLAHIWQVINVFFYNVFGKDDDLYKGTAVVGIIGTLAVFIFTKHLREKIITQKLIDLHHAKISSEEELDVYVQSLLQLYESHQTNPHDELLLQGVVWRHKAECMDPECPLAKNETSKLFYPLVEEEVETETDNIKEKIVILALLNSILKERGKRAGDQASACFHLIYSNFLFRELGNAHMAIVEVMRAQKSSPTTQQLISIYSLLRAIEEFLVKKYRRQRTGKADFVVSNLQGAADFWDVTIVIKYESLLLQFIKHIEQCAGDHIEFWSQLESMMPNLNEVSKIGLRILETSKEIQRIWTKLNKINPSHPKALNIYGYYLKEISNDAELGTEYIEKAIAINLHKSGGDEPTNDFDLMFAEDTAIIMINGSPEQLGKIIKTNSGVLKLLGYNPFEIYGSDVSIIMPGIFARHHTKFMQRYFETGKQFVIKNERVLYALHRNNYLFCVSIVVKPVPSLTTALPQYIGLIRQINKDNDYIITDKNGKIDSISMGIYHMYNLSSSFIKDNHIYIQLICPELADPVSFNDEKVQLKFCAFNGRKKMRFCIPRDFTTLAHLFSQTAKDPIEGLILGGGQQQSSEIKLPYNQAEAPYFFNLVYKMLKAKHPNKSIDIGKDNVLKSCFDYKRCEIESHAICEMVDAYYLGDALHVKVFKVYRPKMIKKSSLDDFEVDEALSPDAAHGVKKRASMARNSSACLQSEAVLPGIAPSEEGKVTTKAPSQVRQYDSSSSLTDAFLKRESKELQKSKLGIEGSSSSALIVQGPNGTDQGSVGFVGSTSQILQSRPTIIKTIDIRQNETARNAIMRQVTLESQLEKKKEDPKDSQDKSNNSNSKEEDKEKDDPPDSAKPISRKETTNANVTSPQGIGGAAAATFLQHQMSMRPQRNDLEEIGSVASTTGNIMRFIRSLRAALHEEGDPPAITQLKRLALIVVATLLLLTMLCYFLSQDIFWKLRNYSDFIVKVRERSSAVLGIGKSVRLLVLLSDEYNVELNVELLDYNNETGGGINYKFNNRT